MIASGTKRAAKLRKMTKRTKGETCGKYEKPHIGSGLILRIFPQTVAKLEERAKTYTP